MDLSKLSRYLLVIVCKKNRNIVYDHIHYFGDFIAFNSDGPPLSFSFFSLVLLKESTADGGRVPQNKSDFEAILS